MRCAFLADGKGAGRFAALETGFPPFLNTRLSDDVKPFPTPTPTLERCAALGQEPSYACSVVLYTSGQRDHPIFVSSPLAFLPPSSFLPSPSLPFCGQQHARQREDEVGIRL